MEVSVVYGAEHRPNDCQHCGALFRQESAGRLVSRFGTGHTAEIISAAIDLPRQYDVWIGRHTGLIVTNVRGTAAILNTHDNAAGIQSAGRTAINARSS